jgi:hypothetical protein
MRPLNNTRGGRETAQPDHNLDARVPAFKWSRITVLVAIVGVAISSPGSRRQIALVVFAD